MAEENAFQKIFDLRKLSEQELGCTEFVLNSPAYVDVFEPYLRSLRESMNVLWIDRSQRRKDEYPDDFLAGGIAMIDGLLSFFHNVIEETRMERVHEAMAHMTPDVQYTERQKRGQLQPVIGLDQPASPDDYDPAEDF